MSEPLRCTWMRMPSSFTSTTAGTPVAASASSTVDALCASIGARGRPTRRDGHLGGPGDRVGEQPGLGTVPQLAEEQAGQQALLVAVAAA